MKPEVILSGPRQIHRVIGIDPGSLAMGWGVVEGGNGRVSYVDSGVIAIAEKIGLQERLGLLHKEVTRLLRTFEPDEVAVERVFVARNADAALKLGHVRGVVLLAIHQAGHRAYEYAPAMVKKMVTGSGRADKLQMVRMVQMQLNLDGALAEDAADALAIAMTHLEGLRLREIGLRP